MFSPMYQHYYVCLTIGTQLIICTYTAIFQTLLREKLSIKFILPKKIRYVRL